MPMHASFSEGAASFSLLACFVESIAHPAQSYACLQACSLADNVAMCIWSVAKAESG